MKITIDDEDIDLESDLLEVDEASINDKLRRFAKTYSRYNQIYAKAQFLLASAEDELESVEGAKFDIYKSNGGSDKLIDAKVSADEQVIVAKSKVREAKYKSQMVFGFLRSLDKSHEDLINLGYNVRKEMDKIFPQEIRGLPLSQHNINDDVANLFKN